MAKGSKLSVEDRTEIAARIKRGEDEKTLAKEYGVSDWTIRYWSNPAYRAQHIKGGKTKLKPGPKPGKTRKKYTKKSYGEAPQAEVPQFNKPIVAFVGSVQDVSAAIRSVFS